MEDYMNMSVKLMLSAEKHLVTPHALEMAHY